MNSTRARQLEQIIALSKQMLERARAGQWGQVAELDDQRRQLVAACFQQPTSAQDASAVGASIGEILDLNARMTALGRDCREQLSGEIHARNVGRNATAAYRNHLR